MGTFFVGWELWEDMSFVLACAIVLVFALAVAKLWWTNRGLRKHEVIEEERRARLMQMRRCGINSQQLGTIEIPFGVRALESGVEVEGIWISRSNTPDKSQLAPSRTLVDEPMEESKGKEKMTDPRSLNEFDTSDTSAKGKSRASSSRTLATSGPKHSRRSSIAMPSSTEQADMIPPSGSEGLEARLCDDIWGTEGSHTFFDRSSPLHGDSHLPQVFIERDISADAPSGAAQPQSLKTEARDKPIQDSIPFQLRSSGIRKSSCLTLQEIHTDTTK